MPLLYFVLPYRYIITVTNSSTICVIIEASYSVTIFYMNNHVVAFVGMPGAGKSLCVEYLENKKNWPSVYLGGVTLDEIKKRGLGVNPKNEKYIREYLREQEGMGVYAKRIIKKIDEIFDSGEKIVVADGIYSWTEYKIFKEKYGDNAHIIAIVAPRGLRHERLANRPHRPLTKSEVSAREYAEIENIEKGGPIANADYTIVNDKTEKELLASLEATLEQINL